MVADTEVSLSLDEQVAAGGRMADTVPRWQAGGAGDGPPGSQQVVTRPGLARPILIVLDGLKTAFGAPGSSDSRPAIVSEFHSYFPGLTLAPGMPE